MEWGEGGEEGGAIGNTLRLHNFLLEVELKVYLEVNCFLVLF